MCALKSAGDSIAAAAQRQRLPPVEDTPAIRVRGLTKSYGPRLLHSLVIAILLVILWPDVLIVAAWGLGGLVLALRHFSWEPRTA